MRIIYLHQYFATPEMHGSTRSYEMARRWVASGYKVAMISTDRTRTGTGKGWSVRDVDGIELHELSVPYDNAMSYGSRMWAFAKFAMSAGFRAVEIGGDVVFATSTPLTIAIPGVLAAKRLKVPMIFEVRDLWPDLPIVVGALRNPFAIRAARWLERFAYTNSERIVALSPGMAEGIAKTGYPAEQITVVPNSCDLDLFGARLFPKGTLSSEYDVLDHGRLVVYTGTLGLINGVEYLAAIAHAMRALDPTIVFAVIGDGGQQPNIRRRAQQLGVLNENFWMLPPVAKKFVPAILQKATLAVSLFINVPALRNNSANKFFDALAAGRPILVNYEGWQADLIRDRNLGVVVPPDDPERAAFLLKEFMDSDDHLVIARAEAHNLARTKFSRDDLAEQALNVIRSAVNSHQG